ncbi:hypothetical protein [Streptomyces sparsogenes]|uniref:hypothetical protein n=1 Tax=Streptomyces sparsogenes TaxID=67365 RepID=UPI0033F64B04
MTVPHTLTVIDLPDGRELDWTHPADCPDGEHCDFARRTHRMGIESMSELADGREPGRYLLGRFGFHGLALVDEHGTVLPDVVEALSPAAQAAREIAVKVIRDLAEGICEDTERLQELGEIIRRAEVLDHWEGAANDAITAVIDENLASMRAYTGPIDRLLGGAA